MRNEIDELVKKLNIYREKYYNGISEIPDEEFDFYERRLKTLDPNNSYFDKVGNKISSEFEEIEHKIPMLSMQKVQTAEDAEKWYNNLRLNSVWVDPKLDGISGKIVYDKNGDYQYASTRGDGLVGALLPYGKSIDGVPTKFLPNSELRGEFIVFKKHKNKFSGPLRNVCSGIMKRKEYTPEVEYVSFVIYDTHCYDKIFGFTNRGDKINKITKILEDLDQKFYIVPVERTSNITEIYNKYINIYRNKWPYETDGIILTIDGDQNDYDNLNSRYKISSFNRFNMALKPPAEFAESEIIDIVPTVNRRKVSFVAIIKPITLLDTNINRATLDNYQNIKKKDIGIGTTVLVKRANDVIPKIFDCYNKPGVTIKHIELDRCPCCGKKLVSIYQDLMCDNEFGCRDVYNSKLENLIKILDGKNIGETVLSAIVDMIAKENKELYMSTFFENFIPRGNTYRYEDKIKIYYDKDLEHEGKRPKIFKDALFKMFENITEIKVISAMNIPYIGENSLLEHGIKSYKNFIDYIEDISKKPVLDEVFDITLVKWFKDKQKRYDLEKSIEICTPFFKNVEDPTDNTITYCISGEVPGFKNKNEFVNTILDINLSFKYTKDLTTSTNYLVSVERSTSKILKANKYKIPIMTPNEFIEMVKKY